jgi:uncharacterized membrane protein YbaN (DUF454 family)
MGDVLSRRPLYLEGETFSTGREPIMTDHGLARPPVARGARRLLYVALGMFFVGLAVLGVVLPVLPTTPFLLLASYFFVRSSPRLHGWLLRSRLFGGFLHDWQRHRAVRPRVKVVAVAVLVAAVSASALLADLSLPLLIGLFALGSLGLVVVLRLPVLREDPLPAPAAQEEQIPA